MPRRRIQDRIIEHRGLAGWVVSRQLLARRVLRGPLLAQIVGPAPARRGAQSRAVFRPRMIADPEAQRESASWIDSANDALATDEPRFVMPAFADDEQPESAEYTPLAVALPDERAAVERSAPQVRVSAEPPRPEEERPTPLVQPTARRALPLRERLGRRVEERVQETPPQAAVPPLSAAPLQEHTNVTVSPRVEQTLPNAPEPYQAETPGVPDEAAMVVLPLPTILPSHVIEATEPELPAEDTPSIAMSPNEVSPDLPDVPPIPQRGVVEQERIASDRADLPDTVIASRDTAITSPAARASVLPPETHDRAALPESEMQRPAHPEGETPQPVQQASEGGPPILAREPPRATPAIVAEPSQPDATRGTAVAAPALSSPAGPEAISAADLFLPRGEDRSPAVWMARLANAARPRSEHAAAPLPAPPPAPAPPAPRGALTPFRAPSPRFVAPVQTRASAVAPVELADTRGSVHAQPDADLTAENDALATVPVAAPDGELPQVVASDAATPQIETAEDDAYTASVSRVPDPGSDTLPESVSDALPEAGRDAELFASPDADRSPGAWIERLRRAERTPVKRAPLAPPTPDESTTSDLPTTGGQRAVRAGDPRSVVPLDAEVERTPPAVAPEPIAERAPMPLPEASRRFLQPLIGIDPGDVPVHVGPGADAVAAAYRADALTDGNVVLLGEGHAPDSPETLGLIAHELTHIARRRDPRFIPPIARVENRVVPAGRSAGAQTETETTDPLADDETVARRVESRVVRAARVADTDQSRQQSTFAASTDQPVWPTTPAHPSGEARGSEPASGHWDGLPAPWEPLPSWLTSPVPESPSMPANVTPLPIAVPPQLAPVAPVAQLAEQGRESDDASAAPETAAAPQHDVHAPTEPDLDALARQVYDLLKRRLALERRSFG